MKSAFAFAVSAVVFVIVGWGALLVSQHLVDSLSEFLVELASTISTFAVFIGSLWLAGWFAGRAYRSIESGPSLKERSRATTEAMAASLREGNHDVS